MQVPYTAGCSLHDFVKLRVSVSFFITFGMLEGIPFYENVLKLRVKILRVRVLALLVYVIMLVHKHVCKYVRGVCSGVHIST